MATNLKLMFLATHRFEKGQVIRGGFLVTDSLTKPLEFKCTNPIRPTLLQKTLYGGILEKHMLVELIGKPLIRSAKEKPNLILVREPLFLELRPDIDIPVLRILKDTEISDTEPSPADSEKDEQSIITSESGKFEPVIISAHKDFIKEREKQRAILNDIFRQHNLLEPFARIITALEQVHAQKSGDLK